MSHEDDNVESPVKNTSSDELSPPRTEGNNNPERQHDIDEKRWSELMRLFADQKADEVVAEMMRLYPQIKPADHPAIPEKKPKVADESPAIQAEEAMPDFTSAEQVISSFFQFLRSHSKYVHIPEEVGNHYMEAFLRFDVTEADLFARVKDLELTVSDVGAFAGFLDSFFGYPMTESDLVFLITKILDSDDPQLVKTNVIRRLPDLKKLSTVAIQDILSNAVYRYKDLTQIEQLKASFLYTPLDGSNYDKEEEREAFERRLHELQLSRLWANRLRYSEIRSRASNLNADLDLYSEDFAKWPYEDQIAAYVVCSKMKNLYTLVSLSKSSDTPIPQSIVDTLYSKVLEESKTENVRLIRQISIISELKEPPSPELRLEIVQQIIEECVAEGQISTIGRDFSERFEGLIEGMSSDAVTQAYEKVFQEGVSGDYAGGVCEDILRRLQASSGLPIPSYIWQQYIFDTPETTLRFQLLTPEYELFEAHFQKQENRTPHEVWRIAKSYWARDHRIRLTNELSEKYPDIADLDDSDDARLLIALRTYEASTFPDSFEAKAASACTELYNYKDKRSLHPYLAETLLTVTEENKYEAPVFCKTQTNILDRLFKKRGDPDFALTDEENIAVLYFLQGGAEYHEDAFALYSRLLSLPLPEDQRDLLKKLFYEQFLDTEYEDLKTYLEGKTGDDGEVFTDEQLRFVYGYSLSPNKALHPLAREWIKQFPVDYLEGASLAELSTRHRSIPEGMLLPLTGVGLRHSSTGNQEDFYHAVKQIDGLYSLTKGKKERDELEWALMHAQGGEATDLFMSSCLTQELKSHADVVLFTETLRMIEAVDVFYAEGSQEVIEAVDLLYAERQDGLDAGLRRLLKSRNVESVAAYCLPIKEHIIADVKKLLGLEEVSDEHITAIVTNWHTIEPLLTYSRIISKEEEVPDFFKTIILHLDPPNYDGWRAWRYSTEDPQVAEQLKPLSDEQKAQWIVDHSLDMGHEALPGTSIEGTITHIKEMLTAAILGGHIGESDDMFMLYVVVNGEQGDTDSTETRVQKFATRLEVETTNYDRIAAFDQAGKLRSFLTDFRADHGYPINMGTRGLVEYMGKYLPEDKAELVKLLYKTVVEAATKSDVRATISAASIFPSEVRELLRQRVEEIDGAFAEAMAGDWARNNTIASESEALEFMKKNRSRRQMQGACLSICALLDARREDLIRDHTKDDEGNRQTTIERHIASLKTYFKDNATFLQDLSNVEFAARNFQEEAGLDRHFVMLSTDDPEILLQIGRYPIGNGSCQNYDGDVQHNKGLCAYVADAHIRTICLFDVAKLSPEYQSMIREGGLDAAMKTVPRKALLDAMVARTIVKLGTYNDTPVLYVEPCYSSLNKRETTINRFFHTFVAKVYGEKMGLSLFYAGRDTSIRIPETRNPGGQYEDGNTKDGLMYDSYALPASYIPGYTPLDPAERAFAESLVEAVEQSAA